MKYWVNKWPFHSVHTSGPTAVTSATVKKEQIDEALAIADETGEIGDDFRI